MGWNCFSTDSAGQLEGGGNLTERKPFELLSHEATEAGAAGGSQPYLEEFCILRS